jgi:hypothetical protein
MRKLFTILLFLFFGAVLASDAFSEEGEIKPDSIARKKSSEQFLKTKKVPINQHLPFVESESEIKIRTAQDTARRLLILYNVAAVGYGIDRVKVNERLKQTGLWDFVSPNEKSFLESKKPSKQQIIDATWRVEALWTLLWALGQITELDFPIKSVDPQTIHSLIPKPEDFDSYIKNAKLRSKKEILDQTDLIYRIHWAVRDAQINGKKAPASLDGSVVVERHYTLNWLTFYGDEWDEITTDT